MRGNGGSVITLLLALSLHLTLCTATVGTTTRRRGLLHSVGVTTVQHSTAWRGTWRACIFGTNAVIRYRVTMRTGRIAVCTALPTPRMYQRAFGHISRRPAQAY